MGLFKRKLTYEKPTITELGPILGSVGRSVTDGRHFSDVRLGGVDGPVSSPGPDSTSLTLVAGTPQTIAAYAERMGIMITADPAATGVFLYGLCGSVAQSGTVSQTNFDFAFGPGNKFDGEIGQSVWSGPIQLLAVGGTLHVGVIEV